MMNDDNHVDDVEVAKQHASEFRIGGRTEKGKKERQNLEQLLNDED